MAKKQLQTRAPKPNSPASSSAENISGGPENISGALEAANDQAPAERVQQAPGDAVAAREPAEPTDDDIRARAYEMYLERGGHHGLDLDDWVRAERELKQRR